MNTKKAITTILALAAALALLVGATGCTALNLQEELKDHPGVKDISVAIQAGTVTCEVILNDDAADPEDGDAASYAALARQAYPRKGIVLKIVRNDELLALAKLPHND